MLPKTLLAKKLKLAQKFGIECRGSDSGLPEYTEFYYNNIKLGWFDKEKTLTQAVFNAGVEYHKQEIRRIFGVPEKPEES